VRHIAQLDGTNVAGAVLDSFARLVVARAR